MCASTVGMRAGSVDSCSSAGASHDITRADEGEEDEEEDMMAATLVISPAFHLGARSHG